ncbi:MAG TPA: 1-acyl-sn-glycerol-3-phosphate acyltransferase [Gemmatimonadota bacterium]|nr:1-acyl-sn-glycerol-3-phosphate acyltransferase [Gemmatimonadota bacterium]
MIGRAVTRATVWASGIFYRVERIGPELPAGPIFIVSNHPNMLMDPLLSLKAARRRVRILAKAPLFEIPIFGSVLRSLDALPLYRIQDDPEQLHRNKLAFQAAVDSLRSGMALLTFPEGKSHSSPALAPLKTGVARMTLVAEEQSGWRLGVRVVPIGLAYYRKHRFRSRVAIGIGEPIPVVDWKRPYEADHAAAIRSLNRAISAGLQRQTLNLADESDRELVETADLLYARQRGEADWRERQALGQRLPRLQQFAEAFAWLRACDPERWSRLARRLRRHRSLLERLGSGDADVPPAYERQRVVRYVVREAVRMGLTLPLAAAGTLAWYLPYFVSGLVSGYLKPAMETVATVKLLAGIVAYPATYVAWVALTGVLVGFPAAALAAVILPLLGLVALRWWQRRDEVSADVKLFLQIVRRPRLRDRLAGRRAALAAELGELLRLATESQLGDERREQ